MSIILQIIFLVEETYKEIESGRWRKRSNQWQLKLTRQAWLGAHPSFISTLFDQLTGFHSLSHLVLHVFGLLLVWFLHVCLIFFSCAYLQSHPLQPTPHKACSVQPQPAFASLHPSHSAIIHLIISIRITIKRSLFILQLCLCLLLGAMERTQSLWLIFHISSFFI